MSTLSQSRHDEWIELEICSACEDCFRMGEAVSCRECETALCPACAVRSAGMEAAYCKDCETEATLAAVVPAARAALVGSAPSVSTAIRLLGASLVQVTQRAVRPRIARATQTAQRAQRLCAIGWVQLRRRTLRLRRASASALSNLRDFALPGLERAFHFAQRSVMQLAPQRVYALGARAQRRLSRRA